MENLGLIITIVGSAIAIVGVTITLMLWVRGEANADRRDIVDLIVQIKQDISTTREETSKLINEIHLEMKDFHHRLLNIESKEPIFGDCKPNIFFSMAISLFSRDLSAKFLIVKAIVNIVFVIRGVTKFPSPCFVN